MKKIALAKVFSNSYGKTRLQQQARLYAWLLVQRQIGASSSRLWLQRLYRLATVFCGFETCFAPKNSEKYVIPQRCAQAEIILVRQEMVAHVVLFDLTKPC